MKSNAAKAMIANARRNPLASMMMPGDAEAKMTQMRDVVAALERVGAPTPVEAGRTVHLDEKLMAAIEANVLRTQIAERDMELAKLQLRGARDRLEQLATVRDELYARVGARAGCAVVGNIRLVDREKCVVVIE